MIMDKKTVNWIIIKSDSSKSKTDVKDEKHTEITNTYVSKIESESEHILSFATVVEHLSDIPLPEKWSYTLVDGEVLMFLKWDNSLTNLLKQIIISQTLEMKVYVNKIAVNSSVFRPIVKLEDIFEFIRIVNDIPVCPGVDVNQRSERCIGFIQPSNPGGRISARCMRCTVEHIKHRRQMKRKEEMAKKLEEKLHLVKKEYRSLKRKL